MPCVPKNMWTIIVISMFDNGLNFCSFSIWNNVFCYVNKGDTDGGFVYSLLDWK